jgi:hypothetical protein
MIIPCQALELPKIKIQPKYACPREGSEGEMGLMMQQKKALTREVLAISAIQAI